MLCTMVVLFACKKDKNYKVNAVTVQLVYPEGSSLEPIAGVLVKMTARGSSFEGRTDVQGKATLNVPADVYEISATDTRTIGLSKFNYNVVKSNVAITDAWKTEDQIKLDLEESRLSQLVIKELYTGGVQRDNGSGAFAYDKYVILYNNSETPASLANICLATTMPYTSTGGNNKYYGADGKLTYGASKWIPAGQAIWYFQKNVTLQPGQQIVIALNNAVNNTVIHTKSINFANANYYCTYDIVNFSHAATYATPSDAIPTENYLKVAKYGAGTAWAMAAASPGFFIFETNNMSALALASDASYNDLYGGAATLVSKKIPISWIVDGVESYELGATTNQKRFTATVDAGYVNYTSTQGYSMYRNVDETATKAIAGNTTKLVYNYQYGTVTVGGTTDPSGIDAEASVKNGARIIYKDTNNSSNDFHMRSRATLRTN